MKKNISDFFFFFKSLQFYNKRIIWFPNDTITHNRTLNGKCVLLSCALLSFGQTSGHPDLFTKQFKNTRLGQAHQATHSDVA